jgi:hypothetical protein
MSEQKTTELSQDHILELLSKLSPEQRRTAHQALGQGIKADEQELHESRSAFMNKVAKRFEGADFGTPPEDGARVTFTFDAKGNMTEKRYTPPSKSGNSGGGSSNVPLGEIKPPAVGTTAYRGYKGTEHSLFRAGEKDYVLNGKDHYETPTAAAKAVTGQANVRGPLWWFVQGRIEAPAK